jgi:hypothetical protein
MAKSCLIRRGPRARCIVATPVALLALGWTASAHAETPAAFCRRVGTDDTTQPIPKALVPAVNATFGMRLSVQEAVATTVFRCVERHVMVCTIGANLPCGKANTSREPSAGMAQYCRGDAEAASIPAAVTGHDTIFEWRCQAGEPRVVRQTLSVDPQGFVAEYWKALR